MMLYSRILETSEATTIEELSRRVGEIGEEMGFGLYSIIVLEGRLGSSWRSFVRNNAPPAFAEASVNIEDGRRDSVLNRVKKYSSPIVYNQKMYTDDNNGDLWEEQATFGYKVGIATVVHLPDGKHVSLGFDRAEPLPTNEMQLGRMIADIQLLTVHAQNAALRLMHPEYGSKPILTGRQLEVLRWTALGKTAWETGQILDLDERTINAHLSVIYRKLDAGSKTQAVFNAASRGLI